MCCRSGVTDVVAFFLSGSCVALPFSWGPISLETSRGEVDDCHKRKPRRLLDTSPSHNTSGSPRRGAPLPEAARSMPTILNVLRTTRRQPPPHPLHVYCCTVKQKLLLYVELTMLVCPLGEATMHVHPRRGCHRLFIPLPLDPDSRHEQMARVPRYLRRGHAGLAEILARRFLVAICGRGHTVTCRRADFPAGGVGCRGGCPALQRLDSLTESFILSSQHGHLRRTQNSNIIKCYWHCTAKVVTTVVYY